MKRILLICLVFISLFIVGCSKEIKEKLNIGLLDYSDYKDIDLDKIESVTLTTYTEGGRDETLYEDKDEIKVIYNNLKAKKLTEKTEMSCDDNTKIYTFKMEDKEISIEIECNILVHGKDRYLIK